jgi:hypothetical protein
MHTAARQIQNHAVIIEPALNRLMQLGCPIYPAVTLDPVNARALAPVGTDESVWCGNFGYKISYSIASIYIYIYIYIYMHYGYLKNFLIEDVDNFLNVRFERKHTGEKNAPT